MEQIPLMNTPVQSAPHFPAAAPEDFGVSPGPLEEAHLDILSRYPRMRSFLIVRGGKLIYERYYGTHHPGQLNDLRSATKSFTSALFGIALAEGLLPPENSPVADVLGRYITRKSDPLLNQITIRHLLTMTSGFAWQTGKKLGEPLIHRFHRTRRWAGFALSLPVLKENIGVFQYRSTDSHLLSVMLTEACGSDAFTYAGQKLFGPMDIRHAAWSTSPEGHSTGHVGLYLTSRDMAKFGLLCLNEGRWRGEELLPGSWLREAMQAQTKGYPAFGDYGYQWWCGRISGRSYSLAHGHGGQQIYVFPELDMVVVFTQDSRVSRWKNPRMLLEQYVLEAVHNQPELG